MSCPGFVGVCCQPVAVGRLSALTFTFLLQAQATTMSLPLKTEEDELLARHRFLRDEYDNAEEASDDSWQAHLARRYYGQFYREFALVDLSQAQSGVIGMRWRLGREDHLGHGQVTCGGLDCRSDGSTEGRLVELEVPFSYTEADRSRQALVKIALCRSCHERLKVADSIRSGAAAAVTATATVTASAAASADSPSSSSDATSDASKRETKA